MLYRRLIPFTAICIFPFILLGCTESTQSDPRTTAPLVRVSTVQEEVTADSRAFTGVVGARVESDLGFRVSGKVIKRLVEAGQTVKRGQVLMRIDPVDLQLAAKAQQEAVDAARARADQAEKDAARYRDLRGSGAISAAAYDQIKAAADAARAQLSSAQTHAKVALNASHYADLIADGNGTIMETLAEPGQIVSAGQTVIRLAHAGQREAVIQLPETLRPAIGTIGQATLFGQENISVPAKLRQLSNTADQLTRTFEARFVLDGALANAPLGSTVTVRIANQNQRPQHVLQVPVGSILDNGKGAGVWVIHAKTNKVAWRSVVVKQIDDEYAYVTGNIQRGDQIVALGAHLLREGESVRISSSTRNPSIGNQGSHS
ncbi:efflux RND transporter periplasmic adaptor subunit [Acinetobacter halotolerans]|uniref:Efflux RND transporter periplasmic adaptor subunit n=1 Tax=Acinetobacter halotolerans TaxID=1752076 RepID=A0A4Q6XJF5_9GAMM|nr:efflux RND transporter periplasmic adaptor subunit [Acinetobacter halotolerans]RZF55885.1 efflux RND transporter periplasmic adaptor subunit [Acinetobacter halotolerans]